MTEGSSIYTSYGSFFSHALLLISFLIITYLFSSICPRFFAFSSMEAIEVSQYAFSVGRLPNFKFKSDPFISCEEQKKIIDFLDRETAKIDSLIQKEKQIIEKIKEYRTALISAAVTGKIDVKGEENA